MCIFDCGGPNQLCVIRVVMGSLPGSSFCAPAKCVTLLEEEYCVVIASCWNKGVAFMKVYCLKCMWGSYGKNGVKLIKLSCNS